MVTNKPSILIYTVEPNKELLREICAGIEEEGVLFEIVQKDSDNLEKLCYDSANESILGSGIGIVRAQAAMSLRLLPMGKVLFEVNRPTEMQARSLGANAARAVKRIPFKEL